MLKKPEEIMEIPVGRLVNPMIAPPSGHVDLGSFGGLGALVASVLAPTPWRRLTDQAPLVAKGDRFDMNEASFGIGEFHEISVKNHTYIVHRTSDKEFKIYRVLDHAQE